MPGLDVDNSIRVDDRCRTSDDSVYAIGDCTNHPNNLLGQRLRLESVHNALEQIAEHVAITKPAVAILGERRMIRYLTLQPEPTEQPIGQVHMNFLA